MFPSANGLQYSLFFMFLVGTQLIFAIYAEIRPNHFWSHCMRCQYFTVNHTSWVIMAYYFVSVYSY